MILHQHYYRIVLAFIFKVELFGYNVKGGRDLVTTWWGLGVEQNGEHGLKKWGNQTLKMQCSIHQTNQHLFIPEQLFANFLPIL